MERPCNYTILGIKYNGYVHGNSKEELDEEEEVLRKAEKMLKSKIIEYQRHYPFITDNVMILSLVALDYACEYLKLSRQQQRDPNVATLAKINEMLKKHGTMKVSSAKAD